MTSVSNWGRWGTDDERGALNLVTPERVLEAIRLVRRGIVYSLAVPLEKDGPQHPIFHKTWCVTQLVTHPGPGACNLADDVVTMETHSGTHMDALGHVWADGLMWNGRGAEHVTSFGVGWAGIHNVGGIVARGVMLDLPRFANVEHLRLGEIVTAAMMEDCARAQRLEIRPGDVLLLRTGWYRVFQKDRELWNQGEPGPDASCTAWLKDKDVVAIGADNFGLEGYTLRERSFQKPQLHTTALRDLGVYLIENLNLDDLARDGIQEFLFVAAPLRLTRASGSPCSPLAII